MTPIITHKSNTQEPTLASMRWRVLNININMKDWGLIINEYKKSEHLKNKDVSNLTWFLNQTDWFEFIEYLGKTMFYDVSDVSDVPEINYNGIKFKRYEINDNPK